MLLFGTGCKRPCLSRMSRRGNIISRRAPWRVRTICVSKSKNGGVVGGGWLVGVVLTLLCCFVFARDVGFERQGAVGVG